MKIIWVKLKLESKDPLLAWVLYSIELFLFDLCMLGVSFLWPRWRVSLAELLLLRLCLWIKLCVEMPEFYDCCGKWVWPSGEPEVWEETWVPALWAAVEDLHHRADAGPCRGIIFWFRFRYVLNSNTSLSIYFFCNSRTHVITLYSGHVCVVLCVNASVLVARMDPG
jgi:hypothetical protein